MEKSQGDCDPKDGFVNHENFLFEVLKLEIKNRILGLGHRNKPAPMTITEHLTDVRPTDAELAAFEELIQWKLPEDYKSFLKGESGGRPKLNVIRFTVKDGKSQDSTIHYFYGLHDGRIGNLSRYFHRYKERIPVGYLPIATDPFGNLMLLKVTGQTRGRVCFWDHEQEEDIPTLKNVFKIADSFSGFVEKLEDGL